MIQNAQIRNILWMFVDKAFLLVGGFVVSVMVARYLGPETLGVISYGLAISAILISISQWGANYTIFDTAVKNEKRSIFYILSTEQIRLYVYILTSVIVIVIISANSEYENSKLYIIGLVIFSQVFLALDIYQFHYNAVLRSKINAKSSIIARTISMSLRFFLVYYEFDIIYFVIPFFLETFIVYVLRRYSFYESNNHNHNHKLYSNHYFHIGIPLVITGVCISIYTKMYEILLGNLVSYEAVGVFNVAFVLNIAWTFIPMSIGISLLSKPIKEKEYDKKLLGYSFVTFVIMLCSLPMLATTYFIPDLLIKLTFGNEYLEASGILFIVSLACLLGTMGFITNRMINSISGGRRYLLKKVILSSLFMLPITIFLIKNYGLYGAGCSFLISEVLNLTVFNYLFNNKMIFFVHKNAIFSLHYITNYR